MSKEFNNVDETELANKHFDLIVSELSIRFPKLVFKKNENWDGGCINTLVYDNLDIGVIGVWFKNGTPHGPGIYVDMFQPLTYAFIEHSNPNFINEISTIIAKSI